MFDTNLIRSVTRYLRKLNFYAYFYVKVAIKFRAKKLIFHKFHQKFSQLNDCGRFALTLLRHPHTTHRCIYFWMCVFSTQVKPPTIPRNRMLPKFPFISFTFAWLATLSAVSASLVQHTIALGGHVVKVSVLKRTGSALHKHHQI